MFSRIILFPCDSVFSSLFTVFAYTPLMAAVPIVTPKNNTINIISFS